MKSHNEYMMEAINLSIESVKDGAGPFAAVIVDNKTGEVLGRGKNRVTLHNDPTAHGEIEAIRDAGKNSKRLEFSDCTLYTSAEPCVGCLTEILFNAEIREIYYGNSVVDATKVGFADHVNWEILKTDAHEMAQKANARLTQIMRDEAQQAFIDWENKTDRTNYYQA